MGKKLLKDQLNDISNIDIAAYKFITSNKCTNSPNSLFNYKAERFKFPHTDTEIERYNIKRSPPEIIMNIIRVLNNKLKSNEYEVWNKLIITEI